MYPAFFYWGELVNTMPCSQFSFFTSAIFTKPASSHICLHSGLAYKTIIFLGRLLILSSTLFTKGFIMVLSKGLKRKITPVSSGILKNRASSCKTSKSVPGYLLKIEPTVSIASWQSLGEISKPVIFLKPLYAAMARARPLPHPASKKRF